jgi:hypothetical protein
MKQSNVVYLSSMQLRRYAEQTRCGMVVVDEAQREVPAHVHQPPIDSIELDFRRHSRMLDIDRPFDRHSYGGSQ